MVSRLTSQKGVDIFLDALPAIVDRGARVVLIGTGDSALENAMRGRTTFVIAHRLATIRNADQILVFDHGRIVEAGAFDDLIARQGLFSSLARAQFIAGEAAPADWLPA